MVGAGEQLNLATVQGRTGLKVAACLSCSFHSRGTIRAGNCPRRGAAPDTHLYSGWQPHLHCSHCFQDAELNQVSHRELSVSKRLTTSVTSQCPEWE